MVLTGWIRWSRFGGFIDCLLADFLCFERLDIVGIPALRTSADGSTHLAISSLDAVGVCRNALGLHHIGTPNFSSIRAMYANSWWWTLSCSDLNQP